MMQRERMGTAQTDSVLVQRSCLRLELMLIWSTMAYRLDTSTTTTTNTGG